MTKTAVGADLLHPFNIIAKLSIEVLRKHLGILASLEILLPVEKPQDRTSTSKGKPKRHNTAQASDKHRK